MTLSRMKRPAITLVELLVAIFLVATLFALAMPAIQAAREATRRVVCAADLRQIGLAFQSYHGANGQFPSPGGATVGDWTVALLPFLEQESLLYDFDIGAPPNSVHNLEVAALNRPTMYSCPSAAANYSDLFGDASPVPAGHFSFNSTYHDRRAKHGEEGPNFLVQECPADASFLYPWHLGSHFPVLFPKNSGPTNHPKGENILFVDGHCEFVCESRE